MPDRNEGRTSFVTSTTIGFVGMVEGWTGTIDVTVTEGYVSYVATGDDPGAHGVAETSGNASLLRFSDAEPSDIAGNPWQVGIASKARGGSGKKAMAGCDERNNRQ